MFNTFPSLCSHLSVDGTHITNNIDSNESRDVLFTRDLSSFVTMNLRDSQTAPARLELYCLAPAAAPRNATFHFLSCFPSDFVVWRRQTEMVCMCVDVTEALAFSVVGAESQN